jgi:hypothetical protein
VVHFDVFEGSFGELFSSVVGRTHSSDAAFSLLISIVSLYVLQVQIMLCLTKRLARTRSNRLNDGHLVRLLPLFISCCPFYDSCALQGIIFDNIVLLFCYRISCPFLDHSDIIPVL